MIERRRALAAAAAGALILLLAAPAAAQGKRFGKAFIQRFKLNPEQVTKLEKVRAGREAGRDKERALRHEINRLVYAPELDSAAVARVADQLAAQVRSNVQADTSLVRDFYLSLDAEQRALWVEHDNRDAHRSRRGRQHKNERAGDPAPTAAAP